MSRRNRNHSFTSSDESLSPVGRRPRAAKKNQKEAPDLVQTKEKYEPTILDILNEDCWRYVLDYVSVRDIVRSELVSRQWQEKVHIYLRGVRLCIRSIKLCRPVAIPSVPCRVVNVKPYYYIKVIEKFGPAIVASDCLCEIGLRTLGENSPDLEELTLDEAPYPDNLPLHFNRLRKLHLRRAKLLKDSHITNLLRYTTLEELRIYSNDVMTGICLKDLKSNLKYLHLQHCKRLDVDHMLAASHRLADLTKLDLNLNELQVLQNVSKILPETPQLEYLGLELYFDTEVIVGLVEAICSLKRLKHLSLTDNGCVVDEWLQVLGQRCQLQSLDVGRCKHISPAGVEAFCRGASGTLTALGIQFNEFTDEDVVRFITLCPDLELLDLQECDKISRSLPARVSALGRRAITLRLSKYTYLDNPITETYPNVVLHWNAEMHLLHEFDDF